ncbi:MAG: hypothetical protein M3Z66_04600 [Chloroflexota bacterium]|nr:hypothetical protein [Chloroflexota bacterium]
MLIRKPSGRLVPLLLLLPLLAGCFTDSLPSQQHPICSWTSAVPINANRLCGQTYRTLSTVLKASVSGDQAAVHRLVPSRQIAGRIIAFGDAQRRDGIHYIRIVPSYTLETEQNGSVGASFGLVGVTNRGSLKAPQVMYLRMSHGVQVISGDQPQQEW